jgi:hypothetical protein
VIIGLEFLDEAFTGERNFVEMAHDLKSFEKWLT